jgi:hypothetical protein
MKPTSSMRGYGYHHQLKRQRLKPLVASGTVRCARGPECIYAELVNGQLVGGLIKRGQPWDLGHVDGDRRRYSGPEHRECNRATETHRARRVSRKW